MRLLLGRRAMAGPAFWAAAALVAQTPAPPALAAGGPSSPSGKPRPETGVILLEPVVQSGAISSPCSSPSPSPSTLNTRLVPGLEAGVVRSGESHRMRALQ
jgi:hypothetical protein